ncbi:MAG: S8 family serine peptidase [Planctomycetota bacterium]
MDSLSFVRRFLACLVALCVLSFAVSQQGVAGPEAKSKLDTGLAVVAGRVAVFVRMKEQLFPRGGSYERFCAAQPASTRRLELRKRIVATLRKHADESYAAARDDVERLAEAGQIRGLRRYWIVNGFACEATSEACAKLAELDEVAFVYRQRYGEQHQREVSDARAANREWTALYGELLQERRASEAEAAFDPKSVAVPWNLKAVRVDRAWADHGVAGKGVVVAVLDDGMMTVPALLPALWRNPGEVPNGKDDDGNGYVDDVFGYDFRQENPYSVTPSGHRHGTMCAGLIAARPVPGDGDRPMATSVAPRALVMPLAGSGQLRAYEYALDNGADVLSMSYTLEPVRMGAYRGLFRLAHEHLAAAGIVSVGGAGNYAKSRPAGTQIGSPKDIPCVIAASGVGRNGEVPSFSSRGPVSWSEIPFYDQPGADDSSQCKPDVLACNADIPVWTRREVWTGARAKRLRKILLEGDGGDVLATGPRGNSFAGPHAAGVAALMLEANPDLPVWHLKRLLESTCKDMGEPGRDTTHGAGMMQADRAVAAARAFAFE